jgi:hypothetical protein
LAFDRGAKHVVIQVIVIAPAGGEADDALRCASRIPQQAGCLVRYHGGREKDAALGLGSAAQIVVLEAGLGQQVDLSAEELLKLFQQAEIGFSLGLGLEFDEKIEVAALGIEAAGRGRAEQIEAAHAEPSAQFSDRGQVPLDDVGAARFGCSTFAHQRRSPWVVSNTAILVWDWPASKESTAGTLMGAAILSIVAPEGRIG